MWAFRLGEDADVVFFVPSMSGRRTIWPLSEFRMNRVTSGSMLTPVSARVVPKPCLETTGVVPRRSMKWRRRWPSAIAGADDAAKDQGHGIAAGVREGREVDEVGGDEDVGGARGRGKLEGRARHW